MNSLSFAIMTVAAALPLGTLLAFRTFRRSTRAARLAELLYMLPMGVSPVILGLGYLNLLPSLPPEIRGSALAIVGTHTVIAYPFVIRAVSGALLISPPVSGGRRLPWEQAREE